MRKKNDYLCTSMQHDFDINNRRESGIVPSETPETAGGAFTHVKVMHTGAVNVTARAVRYGRWHFLSLTSLLSDLSLTLPLQLYVPYHQLLFLWEFLLQTLLVLINFAIFMVKKVYCDEFAI